MVFDSADALKSAGLITLAKDLIVCMKNTFDFGFSEGRSLLDHSQKD